MPTFPAKRVNQIGKEKGLLINIQKREPNLFGKRQFSRQQQSPSPQPCACDAYKTAKELF